MANGMFDFFSDKVRAGDVAVPETEEQRRRRLALLGRSTLTSPTFAGSPYQGNVTAPSVMDTGIQGTSSAPAVADTSVRPRLAPPSPAPPLAPTAQPTGLEADLRSARLRTSGYRDVTGPAVYDAEGRQISGKPVNNDRGVLGRVGDVLRQAVISAGEAYNTAPGNPEQKLMAALGGGIAGGFGGGFRPTIDEERQRLRDIERSTGDEQRILGMMDQDMVLAGRQADVTAKVAAPYLKSRELDINATKVTTDALKDQQTLVFNAWKELPDYDPSDPKHAELANRAQALRMVLPKKEQGKEYFGSWSPDGRFAVMEKTSGQTDLAFGGQAFAKPATVSESDINDTMFADIGLLGKEEISRAALAEMPEDVRTGLKLSAEAERFLSQVQSTDEATGQPYLKYVNPEGGLNESKVIQDAAIGLLELPAGTQLYENELAASRAKSKLARLEQKHASSQKPLRAEIDKLRLLLKGRSTSDAATAVELYKQAKAKGNKKAIAELFKQLS